MKRTFATVTALGLLAIAPAVAQTSMQKMEKPSETPAAQAPATTTAPKSTTSTPAAPSTQSTASAPSSATAPAIVAEQKPDQLLASSFKGTDVVGTDSKKIGDVSDILFDRDGSIKAYVVDVGGFLGIGAKSVAVAPASFQVIPGGKSGERKLKLSMTADQLKQAATFKPHKEASRQTTGASKSPGGAIPASPTRGN